MIRKREINIYIKNITSIFLIIAFILPIQNIYALDINSYFNQNSNPYTTNTNSYSTDPYSLAAQNASAVFDSIIGCTITTESISNSISKVLTKGQKFGAEVNSRYQEIFNSNKDDTVDLTLDEESLEKYYWKAGSDAATLGDFSSFVKKTSYVPSQPVIDTDVRTNTENIIEKQEQLNKKAEQELKEAELERVREQCLNGVAYALAKRQLAKITNDTLAWVNTGFGGDPLFVRDQTSYLQEIADQELFKFLSPISSPANSSIYPYGRDFARSALQNRSNTFEDRSISTMSSYLPENTSVDEWANDFSLGGWNAWFAFTQNEANNPLGYQLIATEELARRQNDAQLSAVNELNQGNGFLSQKKCVEWVENGVYNSKIGVDEETGEDIVVVLDPDELEDTGENKKQLSESYFTPINNGFESVDGYTCLRWETVTPGSIIENQVNNTLTSAVRQLELADSLNESLSVFFQGLLSNLMSKGLRNLDQNMLLTTQNQNNFSISKLYDSLGNNISLFPGYSNDEDVLNVNRGTGVDTKKFDITLDLGDITGTIYYEGCKGLDGKNISCLAQNNPLDLYSKNKIVLNECSDGIDNDKDGLSDSNDPTCATKNTGIVKKGLIRIQKEYIQAVKESKAELPKIMPALGELDYCIPGPNPSWRDVILDDVNYSIEILRSMTVNDKGEIQTIYGDMAELDKKFAESKAGNGLRTAGQAAPIVGSAFGPVGTVVGSVVGVVFNLIAEKERINYYNQKELRETYLVNKITEFEQKKQEGIVRIIKTFTSYENDYEKLYGPNSPMRQAPGLLSKSNVYLPMANAGLELTQYMHIYARNIDKAENDYEELIAETDANIYKMEEIKKKVDAIVLKARARRAEEIRTGKLVIPAECKGLVDLGTDVYKNESGRPTSTTNQPTAGSSTSSGTSVKNNNVTNTKNNATQGTGVFTGTGNSGGATNINTKVGSQ